MSLFSEKMIKVSVHNVTAVAARVFNGVGTLDITEADGGAVVVFLEPHVATLTAAAMTRAMQAKRTDDGFLYPSRSGAWHIAPGTNITRGVWQFQHENVETEPDGEGGMQASAPYHGTGRDLFDCMDQIDAMVAEDACDACDTLSDDLRDGPDGTDICADCHREAASRAQAFADDAGDARAHAFMEAGADL